MKDQHNVMSDPFPADGSGHIISGADVDQNPIFNLTDL